MGEMERTPLQVTVKEVAPLKAACVDAAGAREEVSRVLMDLFRWVLTQGLKVASYPMALFHGEAPGPHETRFTACIPVDPSSSPRGSGEVVIRDLPALKVVSVNHRGAHGGVGRTLTAMKAWAAENGYEPAMPVREIYLVNPLEGAEEDLLMELQLPVRSVRH